MPDDKLQNALLNRPDIPNVQLPPGDPNDWLNKATHRMGVAAGLSEQRGGDLGDALAATAGLLAGTGLLGKIRALRGAKAAVSEVPEALQGLRPSAHEFNVPVGALDADLPAAELAKAEALRNHVPANKPNVVPFRPKPKPAEDDLSSYFTNSFKPKEKASISYIDESMGPNASGESSASMEAINRLKSMMGKGQKYVVFDRGGNARPMIGPDAVDYVPRNGESLAIMNPDGTFTMVQHNGGRLPQ